jgi:hypothetical protein
MSAVVSALQIHFFISLYLVVQMLERMLAPKQSIQDVMLFLRSCEFSFRTHYVNVNGNESP